MAEKGIAIADQDSGTKVATRDAVEQTGTAEPRVVQIVDFASRSVTPTILRSAVTAADSAADVDSTTADWYTGRIVVGDKSTLVVLPAVAAIAGLTSVSITPVLYGSDGACIGHLATKTVAKPAVPMMTTTTDGMLPAAVWDLFGAYYVGLHVTALDGTGTVTLKGGVI